MSCKPRGLEAEVRARLDMVTDPELDEPVTDIGFITSVAVEDGRVEARLGDDRAHALLVRGGQLTTRLGQHAREGSQKPPARCLSQQQPSIARLLAGPVALERHRARQTELAREKSARAGVD